MVRNSIASKLDTLPTGHSDRIMSMRVLLEGKQHLTLFSVYAPTLLADLADKDIFYSDLRRLLNNTPEDDKVLILGDFNARVGKDCQAWQGVLGRLASVTVTTMGASCSSSAQSTNLSSPTQSFNKKTAWKLPGCTPGQNIGTYLTMC